MTTIAHILAAYKKFVEEYMDLDYQKGLLNIKAIRSAKTAGEMLLKIKEVLAPATKTKPVMTDMGEFKSFSHFLTSQGINRASAYRFMKLAEHWDVVEKLGMQDEQLPAGSMRLCRTIKVLEWYLERREQGVDESLLTLQRYWDEVEGNKSNKASGAPQSIAELKEQLTYYQQRCELLEQQMLELLNKQG